MKGKYSLIDTNILVYAYDRDAGEKHETARDIVKESWEKGGIVCLQNLSEFFVVITSKVEKPVSIKQAREIVEDVISSEEWIVIVRTEESFKKAMELTQKTGIHLWDTMISATMLSYGITRIITENKSDFSQIKGIEPINPFI